MPDVLNVSLPEGVEDPEIHEKMARVNRAAKKADKTAQVAARRQREAQEETVDFLTAYVQRRPTDHDSKMHLCNELVNLKRWEEAYSLIQTIAPYLPREITMLDKIGAICAFTGRHAESGNYLHEAYHACQHSPMSAWNRSLWLLQQGRWGEAWPDYEWGRVINQREKRHKDNEWDGSPIPGKTLYIWAEQGLGDTIMMVRLLAPAVRQANCARVVLEVQQELLPLFVTLGDGNIRVVARMADSGFVGQWDEHISLYKLPEVLHIDSPAAFRCPPYLHSSPLVTPLEGKKRIGVCWKGSANHANDLHRSIPPEQFLATLKGSESHVCSLRGFDPLNELSYVSLMPGTDLPEEFPQEKLPLATFDLTAQVIEACDLVITVDTSVAHLAGAMGRPTWLLLASDSDWRWGLRSETTPIYDSVTLLRQPVPLDWQTVLDSVRGLLTKVGKG